MATKENNQPKNHNHVLIGIIVILGLAAVIALVCLINNRTYYNYEDLKAYTDDASRLVLAVTQYQTNNNGKIPTDASKLQVSNFPYSIAFETLNSGEVETLPLESETMHLITNAKCNGNQAEYNGNKRNFVVMFHAQGNSTICVE